VPGGSLIFTLDGPADCTLTPTGGQAQPAVNGPASATWDVVCSDESDHTFTGTNTLTPTLPLHVVDAETDNNSGDDQTTVAIIAVGNLNVAITGVPAETDTLTANATINATVTISNTGDAVSVSWTGTVVGSGAVPCIVNSGGAIAGGPATIPPTQINVYGASLTVPAGSHECEFTIEVCATAVGEHQTGEDCDEVTGKIERDVLIDKWLLLVGPAAVNLSDTNGRYMWVITEIGNKAADAELVHINMSIAEAVPNGCTRTEALIIPGARQFYLAPGEQKTIVWRVRYECHEPATIQVINQTVTVGVTHCDPTTSLLIPAPEPTTVTPNAPGGLCQPNSINEGPGDVESFVSNNTKTQLRQVIIQ
jgi:hypothetical protein